MEPDASPNNLMVSRLDDGSPTPDSEVAGGDEPETGSQSLRTLVEWIAVIVVAFAAALLIKAFVFQAFEIPTGSMQTTVNIGDRILVNKLSYRFGDVERGDLVVFEKLEGSIGDTDDLIKRVIGLPGETIEVRDDGRIWVWSAGERADDAHRLDEPYLDQQNAILQVPRVNGPATSDIWHESCANAQLAGRCTLDEHSFFVMGDNRFGSSDSRFFGPVPEENLVGEAFARIWPVSDLGGL